MRDSLLGLENLVMSHVLKTLIFLQPLISSISVISTFDVGSTITSYQLNFVLGSCLAAITAINCK
ncbi:hypothetical protein TOL_2244 [Thalassolituus oleivorans MIL-1]|uniref:Uncharacterized protein n=1 Tax=Thalassolituus oleivorans MIL-1 TaxID=1298593 RepID=M5DTV3_9GAMM|nr:hypothetical protein TOL_2244 [Thalassolituus oleivorans MIL-1]